MKGLKLLPPIIQNDTILLFTLLYLFGLLVVLFSILIYKKLTKRIKNQLHDNNVTKIPTYYGNRMRSLYIYEDFIEKYRGIPFISLSFPKTPTNNNNTVTNIDDCGSGEDNETKEIEVEQSVSSSSSQSLLGYTFDDPKVLEFIAYFNGKPTPSDAIRFLVAR